MNNDSIQKTLVVAVGLCLVCSLVVSTAAVFLKPKQAENKALDKQSNILGVVGLLNEGGNIKELYAKNIESVVVDLETGEYVEGIDAAAYDQRAAAADPALSIALDKGDDIAGIGRRAKQASVYLVRDEQGDIKYYILPVHGYGLWSTLYGFLALEADANTVFGLSFYDHAETPGLGGEVDNPKWKAIWKGKKVYNDEGIAALNVVKGPVNPISKTVNYEVDGLAGATLTSRGVSNMIAYWLGENGFNKFLNNKRPRG